MSARESSPLVPGSYADPVASAWLLELGAVARRAERQTMLQSSSRLRLLGWSSRREGVRKRRRLIEQMLVSVETPTGDPDLGEAERGPAALPPTPTPPADESVEPAVPAEAISTLLDRIGLYTTGSPPALG